MKFRFRGARNGALDGETWLSETIVVVILGVAELY